MGGDKPDSPARWRLALFHFVVLEPQQSLQTLAIKGAATAKSTAVVDTASPVFQIDSDFGFCIHV